MFTKKEDKEFCQYLKTASIDDLFTPDLPEIQFPQWLRPEIQTILQGELEFIKEKKVARDRIFFDMYPHFVTYFNRVKPAFIKSDMKPVWEKLYNESPKATLDFVNVLLRIENKFYGGVRLIEKQKDEVKSYKRVIQKAEAFLDAMEEYKCHYYGHMLQDNHDGVVNIMTEFKVNSIQSLEEFKQDREDEPFFCDYWPITRNYKADNALAIFFVRKIYSFFQDEFQKPMHNIVAKLVNAMFDTAYQENEIIKFVGVLNIT